MEFLAGLCVVIGSLIGVRVAVSAEQKRKREKALRDAHTFTPPNVHGNAGEASKQDARAKGWLK